MQEAEVSATIRRAIEILRNAGALFAYLHGSRATDAARPDSDVDIAAYFGQSRQAYEILLPSGVDLLVLDDAPLELAGRVAKDGRLLYDDAPRQRIHWEATTRKIYADEQPRMKRAHDEFLEAIRRG